MNRISVIFYVSRSRLDQKNGDETVDAIACLSATNNVRRNITGALVYTGSHFAQTLEGSRCDVESLMGAIVRDQRHEQLIVLRQTGCAYRKFDSWSMAYPGRTSFLTSFITRLHRFPVRQVDVDRLSSILRLVVDEGAMGSIRTYR